MQKAIRIGTEGMRNGMGGPFGCVIIKDNQVVGTGCNSVLKNNDPTAHAEVIAIRDACKNMKTFQLTGCDVYTSCEPCPMCIGAIYWARPDRVFFANTRHDAAQIGFDDLFIYEELNVPFSKKKIPMHQVNFTEAAKMFEEWTAMNNKKLY